MAIGLLADSRLIPHLRGSLSAYSALRRDRNSVVLPKDAWTSHSEPRPRFSILPTFVRDDVGLILIPSQTRLRNYEIPSAAHEVAAPGLSRRRGRSLVGINF